MKNCFGELLNVKNEREELMDVGRVEGLVLQIQEEELMTLLEKMKKGKVAGPLEVSTKVVKALGTVV